MADILVAEDNIVMQKLLSKRLHNAGHEVRIAVNGVEALALLERQAADIILSDIAMPFVLLTTSVLDQHRLEARQSGANGFLQKPVSSWELEAMIEKLLAAQRRVSQP
jgi:CheY-like chemotaxis protein